MSAPNPFELLDDDDRRAAMAIQCRHCKAQPGQPCVVAGARKARSLSSGRMHPTRVEDGKASRRPAVGGGGYF